MMGAPVQLRIAAFCHAIIARMCFSALILRIDET